MKFPIITLCSMLLTLAACKKNKTAEPRVYQEERPIEQLYNRAGLTIHAIASIPAWEIGTEFRPKVKGKIKAITLNTPIVRTEKNARLTIWNAETKTILAQQMIRLDVANSTIVYKIAEIQLEKDKLYCVSLVSSDAHIRSKPDGGNIAYPITCGNIIIEGHKIIAESTNPASYPTTHILERIQGDFGFVFQQVE